MTYYTIDIPDLLGGVSQRAADSREANQLEVQENAYPSPVDGLIKRFSSSHLARVGDGQRESSSIHTIERDGEAEYVVVFTNRGLKVYDLEGTEYTVVDENNAVPSFAYLDTSAGLGNLLDSPENFAQTPNPDAPPLSVGRWTQNVDLDPAVCGPVSSIASPFNFGQANILQIKATPVQSDGTAEVYQEQGTFPVASDTSVTSLSIYVKAGSETTFKLYFEGNTPAEAGATFDLAGNGGAGEVTATDTGIDAKIEQYTDTTETGWYYCRIAMSMADCTGLATEAEATRYFGFRMNYPTGPDVGGGNIYVFGALARDNVDDPDLAYTDVDVIRAVTVNDYTFIANSTRTVATDADSVIAEPIDKTVYGDVAYLWVRQGGYKSHYSLSYRIEGNGAADTQKFLIQRTWDGYFPLVNMLETVCVKTNDIADQFGFGKHTFEEVNTVNDDGTGVPDGSPAVIPNPFGAVDQGGAPADLNSDPDIIRVEQRGSVLVVYTGPGKTFSQWRVTDSAGGDSLMVAFQDRVEFADDLPTFFLDEAVVKVTNATEQAADDYYLKFISDQAGDPGAGYWEESIPPGLRTDWLNTTMPHQLIRQKDDKAGTITGVPFQPYFQFKPVDWQGRLVGDDESNGFASLEGRTIRDIFFHKGRLGLLSGESCVLSEVNNFFNFFRTSTITVPDNDPIDIFASHTRVSVLNDAVAFQGNLVLFSDQDQFLLEGSPLTPRTAALKRITSYENYRRVQASPAGQSIYFGFKRQSHSGLYEMRQLGEEALFEAEDVTVEVPKYIPGEIKQVAASTVEDVVAVLSVDVSNEMFIYKYEWVGNQKRLSSWGKWVFDGDARVESLAWIDDTLLMTVQRSDGLFLESILFTPRPDDEFTEFHVRLDRRITNESPAVTSVTYDAPTNLSTFRVAFEIPTVQHPNIRVLSREAKGAGETTNPGADFVIDSVTTGSGYTDIVVEGDKLTSNVWIGLVFKMLIEFSEPNLKLRDVLGQQDRVVVDGRYQIRYGTLSYDTSAFFSAFVKPKDYPEAEENVFLFTELEEEDLYLNEVRYPSGDFRFPIYARNKGLRIYIESENQYPAAFTRVQWEATYTNRAQRWRG